MGAQYGINSDLNKDHAEWETERSISDLLLNGQLSKPSELAILNFIAEEQFIDSIFGRAGVFIDVAVEYGHVQNVNGARPWVRRAPARRWHRILRDYTDLASKSNG